MEHGRYGQPSGYLYAALAFLVWGLFPVYWKFLLHVPATEILAHRIVWSSAFVAILLLIFRKKAWFAPLSSLKTSLALMGGSLFLGFNWWLYIWAVNSGQIVETSMGYYINPLVSILFGVVIVREKLSGLQWLAVFFAGAGVLVMTLVYGQFPWIALSLAVSFALYGLLKKLVHVDALNGLLLETLTLFPVAALWLFWLDGTGQGHFLRTNLLTDSLLAIAGVVTALPLIWFAEAIRRIPLSMVGFMQYIGPTIALILGVFVYGEDFGPARLASFSLIWIGLGCFILSVTGVLSKLPVFRRLES